MSFSVAIQMQRKRQMGRWGIVLKVSFQEQPIGTEIDELLAFYQAGDDLGHIFVDQRFATGDGYDRCAALLDGGETFLQAETLIKDLLRIANFPAARAGKVAAKQGLKHQDQGITSLFPKLLTQ
jgi:hypothetical protein